MKYIMDHKLFQVGVKAVVIQNGKALLLQRRSSSGQLFWDIPGGRMRDKENSRETLLRELKEELPGIQNIHIERLVDGYRAEKEFSDGSALLLLVFAVTADMNAFRLSEEHLRHTWADSGDIHRLAKNSDTIFYKQDKRVILEALVNP